MKKTRDVKFTKPINFTKLTLGALAAMLGATAPASIQAAAAPARPGEELLAMARNPGDPASRRDTTGASDRAPAGNTGTGPDPRDVGTDDRPGGSGTGTSTGRDGQGGSGSGGTGSGTSGTDGTSGGSSGDRDGGSSPSSGSGTGSGQGSQGR